MSRRKITHRKKIKNEIDKYPMVSVEWYDIVSNSIGLAFKNYKNLNLLHVLLKAIILTDKGVTKFWSYSFADNGVDIESVGNTTIIPNNVIKDIKKSNVAVVSLFTLYKF